MGVRAEVDQFRTHKPGSRSAEGHRTPTAEAAPPRLTGQWAAEAAAGPWRADGLDVLPSLLACDAFREAFALQLQTLEEFHRLARRIAGPTCPVSAPPESMRSIRRNFFSTFFLAVTRQLVGPSPLLPLYAMVNQGMRAWVTACDNLLDDEYKEVLPLGLAAEGERMKSVLTLLIADRVVAEFVARRFPADGLQASVGRASLRALLPSALQECSEEHRPVPVLPPRRVLAEVHGPKTGELFAAPLALPVELDHPPAGRADDAIRAVRDFGLACQIIDDLKDMPADVRTGRHNLIVSILAESRRDGAGWLAALRTEPDGTWTAWGRFGDAAAAAVAVAGRRFESSFDAMAAVGIDLSRAQRLGIVACMFALLGVPLAVAAAAGGPR